MGMNLFDDSDDTDNISKIETNDEFARRYEYNKKREELQRLEELKKRGLVEDSEESSSDFDEEDEESISGKRNLLFLGALVKVKKNDPIINGKDAKLFESESESEDEESEENEKKPRLGKEKPMYLKDVVAKQLIEEGPEFEEEELKSGVKSYLEEQEELRRDFLKAAGEVFEGDDGDLLMEKNKTEGGVAEGDEENHEIQKRFDEYFGSNENLDDNEVFLKKFFLNKMWVGKDKGKEPCNEELCSILDNEVVEKQELYESKYNFRYEENAGDQVLVYPRVTEGSVRKKTNARKLQRQSKEERMAHAELERKEELKHMKNLKKKEILEKLEKIRAIAGIAERGACLLNEEDLEEDFDPEEYDQKMKETFDADYYDAEDADPGFCSDGDDLEKPDFDKEDGLLGLPKDWDMSGSGDGFSAAREKVLTRKANGKGFELTDDSEHNEEEFPKEGKRKRKRKIPLREKVALDKEFEEYYKLDYEDTIGDIKTRFKYTSVPSQRYGLSGSEILMADDKELNQYVSLRKLAPYRENEWKVHNLKRYNYKMKNKLVGQEVDLKDQKTGKKHSLKGNGHSATLVTGAVEQGKAQLEELNGEVRTMSKRSRRRRGQVELKLSQSRLMAFGKIPAKSKNKKKH